MTDIMCKGHNVAFKIGTDFLGGAESINYQLDNPAESTTTLADTAQRNGAGLPGWSGSVGGYVTVGDAAAASLMTALGNGTTVTVYWLEGTVQMVGTALVTSIKKSGSAGKRLKYDVSLTGDGFPQTVPDAWNDATAYVLDDRVKPGTPNGHFYKCTKAGTSDATEPTWPTVVGESVEDGTAIWTCIL